MYKFQTPIAIFLCIILIVFATMIAFFQYSRPIIIDKVHRIDSIIDATQIVWGSSGKYVYIKNGLSVYKYEIKERNLSKLKEFSTDFVIDVENGEIIYCFWENFEIQSPKDIATVIKVISNEEVVLHEFKSSKMVKPVECGAEETVTEYNYPNSPDGKFLMDFKTGTTENYVATDKPNISGIKQTKISVAKKTYLIETPNIFTTAEFTDSKIALLDTHGSVWLAEYR